MITTRDIKVDLNLGKRPLKQVTTKSVDVYVKPDKPQPTKIVASTHTIEDVADIAEKARRDKIMGQKKESVSKIVVTVVEEGKAIIEPLASAMGEVKNKQNELVGDGTGKSLDETIEETGFQKGDAVYQDEKGELKTEEQLGDEKKTSKKQKAVKKKKK